MKTTCFFCGDDTDGEEHKKTCLRWKEDIKKEKEAEKETLAIVISDLKSRLHTIDRWHLPETREKIKKNTDRWVELQKERIGILEALEKLK